MQDTRTLFLTFPSCGRISCHVSIGHLQVEHQQFPWNLWAILSASSWTPICHSILEPSNASDTTDNQCYALSGRWQGIEPQAFPSSRNLWDVHEQHVSAFPSAICKLVRRFWSVAQKITVLNLLISCGSTHVFNKDRKSSFGGPARSSSCSRFCTRFCTRRSSALSSSRLTSHIVLLALAVVKSTTNPSRSPNLVPIDANFDGLSTAVVSHAFSSFESTRNSMISSSLRFSFIQIGLSDSSIFSNTSDLLCTKLFICSGAASVARDASFHSPRLVCKHLNIGIKMLFFRLRHQFFHILALPLLASAPCESDTFRFTIVICARFTWSWTWSSLCSWARWSTNSKKWELAVKLTVELVVAGLPRELIVAGPMVRQRPSLLRLPSRMSISETVRDDTRSTCLWSSSSVMSSPMRSRHLSSWGTCALCMPDANCVNAWHSSVYPYFTRSLFVTYLLRSVLGTESITITGATSWSASAASITSLFRLRWSGLNCHGTPTHVAMNTRSHLSCCNILAILVPLFTPSGRHRISRDVPYRHRATCSGLRLALHCFSPTGVKCTDSPKSTTGRFQVFPHRRWSGIWTHNSLQGIHDINGSFSSVRLPNHSSNWLLKILVWALISRTPTSARPFAWWSPSGDVICTNRQVVRHTFNLAQQWSFIVKPHQNSLEPQTLDECIQEWTRIIWCTLPVKTCRSQASSRTVSALDTRDRQHVFSVTTEETVVYANFVQFSFFLRGVCVHSTLRRNAMATPASVQCMSRQHMFCNLSCTGLRRKVWHSRHHALITIHRFYSHWILCTSCSLHLSDLGFPVLQVRTLPGTPRFFVFGSCFLSVSCSCTRCSLCTQKCNRGIENLSAPSEFTHRFSSQQSNLCGTCNLCYSTRLWLHPSSCTHQQTTTAHTPALEHQELWDLFPNRHNHQRIIVC